jgi:hypothetical protein
MTGSAFPCFDTYFFLQKGSMVYPYRSVVLDLNGEYSFNSINSPQEDMFFSNGNIYYGIANELSIQFSMGSGEKERNSFKLDTYGIRAVYNMYSSGNNNYTLDVIGEHNGGVENGEREFELSFPNIFHFEELTYVIHPKISYAVKAEEYTPGAHAGLFYDFNESGVIGVEYASVHSSSYAGNRITQNELSASLFFGARIGNNF